MGRLKIGLLGASRVATFAVIEPARRLDGVEVAAVAARDVERARGYAEKHGITRVHADYAGLLADPEIDLVYLGTPPAVHAEQALAAIAAAKPVLVEKPFALHAEQARQVHDAAKAAGIRVFEAMHSPHHQLFARILEIVRGGEIGAIRSLKASFVAPIPESDPLRWTSEMGGGALMDLGVYPLAWVRRIAGERFTVRRVTAEFRHGVDASFSALLEFPGEVACELMASMTAAEPGAAMTVVGSKGRIEVRNPVAPQWGHALTVSIGSETRVETVEGPTSFEAQLEAVRATLVDGAPFPFADDDYVLSMEAIERVRAALR